MCRLWSAVLNRAKEVLGYDACTKDEEIKMNMKIRYFLLLGRKNQT